MALETDGHTERQSGQASQLRALPAAALPRAAQDSDGRRQRSHGAIERERFEAMDDTPPMRVYGDSG